MPRGVIADAFGPPETYALRDLPEHALAPNEVRVEIKAAGISYVDVLTAAGQYQVKPPLPHVPGWDVAGVVAEIGTAVTTVQVGDEVVINPGVSSLADIVALGPWLDWAWAIVKAEVRAENS